jgi:dTDP-4-dehydrorhamnose 3,5-epimerase-like enzyme
MALWDNFAIGALALVSEDNRRRIREFNGSDFSLQGFEIYAAIPLGNHFHEKKEETFVLTSGKGKLLTQNILVDEDGARSVGDVREFILEAPMVIRVPRYVAHTFVLDPGSTMMCFSSAPFNPDDKDMQPFKLS